MTADQLRKSILQQAIQGKLVPQDPNDEPASVLLERIREEKARLVEEKKIKKEKNPSVIFRGEDNSYYEKFILSGEVKCIDEEIPFEMPNGWEWCRLGDLGLTETGTTPPKSNPNFFDDYIPFLSPANIQQNRIVSENQWLSKEGMLYGRVVPCNSILQVCIGGSIGKCAIVSKSVTFNQQINSITPVLCETKFLYWSLLSNTFLLAMIEKSTGTATPIINKGNWERLLLPLPPLSEQQRIVEKIEELIPHIEHYGKAQTELDLLNKNIKEQLKKSVLQYAIEGKLVPQDETEGMAEELLQQIQKEKQKLYEENKLKKKDLEHSTIFKAEDNKYYEKIGKNVICIDEEIPFEIPNGWVWTRGTTLFLPMESTKPKGENFTYIDLDAVNNKKNNIDNPKILKSINAPSRASRKLHTNDVLYSMVRPYLRNIALVDKKFSNAIASTGFYVITPSIALHPHFLFHLMLSSYVTDGLNLFMKGENSPSINNSHIEDFLYPLPPLAEQQRIVESIDAIFRCIEKN